MDKLDIKGQVAFQFLVLMGVFLFIFITFLSVISGRMSELNQDKEIMLANDVLISVQKEIAIASSVLDGYSRTFYVPKTLDGIGYDITIIGNNLLISTNRSGDFSRKIINVSGNITKEHNAITKTGGVVHLN